MARLIRPRELWKHKLDPRVMQTDPRKNGVSASDVSNWMSVINQGMQMAGPIVGAMNANPDASVEVAPDSASVAQAQELQAKWDKATEMGYHPPAAGTDIAASRVDDAKPTQMNSAQLMAAANQAAIAGDRSRAAQLSKAAGNFDFSDVPETKLFGGDAANSRRRQVQQVLAAGKYPDEAAIADRNRRFALSELEASRRNVSRVKQDGRLDMQALNANQAAANERVRRSQMQPHEVDFARTRAALSGKALDDFDANILREAAKLKKRQEQDDERIATGKKQARTAAYRASTDARRADQAEADRILNLGKRQGGKGGSKATAPRYATKERDQIEQLRSRVGAADAALANAKAAKERVDSQVAKLKGAKTEPGKTLSSAVMKANSDFNKAKAAAESAKRRLVFFEKEQKEGKFGVDKPGQPGTPGTAGDYPIDNISDADRRAVRDRLRLKDEPRVVRPKPPAPVKAKRKRGNRGGRSKAPSKAQQRKSAAERLRELAKEK